MLRLPTYLAAVILVVSLFLVRGVASRMFLVSLGMIDQVFVNCRDVVASFSGGPGAVSCTYSSKVVA